MQVFSQNCCFKNICWIFSLQIIKNPPIYALKQSNKVVKRFNVNKHVLGAMKFG